MIYLIRHGETEANARRLYCGSTDLPLSAQGRAALAGLHYFVAAEHFVTSGMKRTEETLALLFGDVPHTQEPAFREMDFGSFEMRSYAQLKSDPDYQAWLTGDNEANCTPGGESGQQMTARALAAFAQLPDGTVLVTHGGVIAAIMAHRFPEKGKNRYQWQPRPGHGYALGETDYYEIP